MEKKNLSSKYMKYVRLMVLILVSFRMFCHLFYTTEMEFQLFKDLEIYRAMVLLCIIVAIYRGIHIKDIHMWVYAAAAGIVLYGYFKFKQISAVTYGPEYFELTLYRGVLQLLFVGLMLDLLRHKPYKISAYIKNPIILLYLFFSLVFFITNRDTVIPFICPILALLFTRFTDEEKEEMTYIFSLSAYLAFAKIFTTSLIQNPNNYLGGRYYGVFQNIGSAGAACAVALVSCEYMLFRFKEKKNWAGLFACIALAVYPAIAILLMGSRSVELGVFFSVLGIWIFVHGKGIHTTYVRVVISLLVVAMIPFVLYGLSKILYALTEGGKIDAESLNYFWSHVLRMTTAGPMEDCIFEPGTFLFALDALASTRISIYVEKVRWIRFTGFNEYSRVGFNSHNFFLANLVRYGLIGGLPFIGWFFSVLFTCAKRVNEKRYMIYPIFLFLLMLGCYSTQSLYINCMGGILMLVTQNFCLNEAGDSALKRTEV